MIGNIVATFLFTKNLLPPTSIDYLVVAGGGGAGSAAGGTPSGGAGAAG